MKRKNNRIINVMMLATVMMLLTIPTAHAAGGFANSNIALGTQRLLEDVSHVLMILGPIAGAAFAGYFLIRRGMADEPDGRMWNKRIATAIICGVAVLLVGGIINLISGYYI